MFPIPRQYFPPSPANTACNSNPGSKDPGLFYGWHADAEPAPCNFSILTRVLLSGEKQMKTLIMSMILSVMFLSAGAFAGARHEGSGQLGAALSKPGNVTVVSKNQAWPLAGWISVEPCNLRRCIGV